MVARSGTEAGPLAVSDGARHATVLLAAAAARRSGVSRGMPVAAARALVPGLVVCPRDETAERVALSGIADWAWQFSSRLALHPPQALLLETGASLTLFGGFDALLERLRSGLRALGYHAVLASAPTPAGALSLARCGRDGHAGDIDALRRALAPLPLSVLDWEAAVLARLHAMGVRCVADVLRLPRDGLGRRFGARSVRCLDRLFGRLPDPQPLYTPPERFERRLSLPAEVEDAHALLFALQRLIRELCGWLQGRGAGVQRLDIDLLQRGGRRTCLRIGAYRESRDADQWVALLAERLERLILDEPVIEVALRTGTPSPLEARSLDLFAERASRTPVDLLDRLRARLGDAAVRGLSAVAEHRPEYAWRYSQPGQCEQVCHERRRPLWLLPVARQLPTRDGRPCLQGRLRLQPDRERIEAGWWDGQDIARDYFIAVNPSGSRYWVYRELTGERRWFLQGVFE